MRVRGALGGHDCIIPLPRTAPMTTPALSRVPADPKSLAEASASHIVSTSEHRKFETRTNRSCHHATAQEQGKRIRYGMGIN